MWIAPRACDVDYKCKSDMGCDQSQQSLNCFCTIYKPLELPIIICCMLLIGYLPHALPVFYGCAMLLGCLLQKGGVGAAVQPGEEGP